VKSSISPSAPWRAWPANILTFGNLGAGAMVAWWAASEFDLGWAASEWAASIGVDRWLMDTFGIAERRVMGVLVMLGIWTVGLVCDVLDGAVARAMGAEGKQGALLDSMADLVSGGLAPAFVGVALMKEWMAAGLAPLEYTCLSFLPMLVLPAAAWRLARYAGNALETEQQTSGLSLDFEGIPAPFSAVWWGLLLAAWALGATADSAAWLWWCGLLGGTALPIWMASKLPQFGLKQWGQFRWMDGARIGWVIGVLILVAFGGTEGLVLALISYPTMGAILDRALPTK
jgi:phosphatidylserine synthase